MMMLSPFEFGIILLILLTLSAYLSGAETALFSLSSLQIKHLQSSGNLRQKLIAQLLSQPRDLLVTLMMLNVQVNILIQNAISTAFADDHSWLLSVGLPLGLTLVFGEILPKTVALAKNKEVSYHVAPTMTFLLKMLGPIRSIAALSTEKISKVMFFFLKRETDISKEELQHVLRTSQKHGVLHAEEVRLAWGYLSLSSSTAKEVMRPRGDMRVYYLGTSLDELSQLFLTQKLSRVPICKGENLDAIIGILSLRRFFLEKDRLHSPDDLELLCDKPFYVPESISAEKLLAQLTEKDEEMAIVVDEYGAISGLITREDLYEVVIGEIYSHPHEKTLYTLSRKDTIIASGKLELHEFDSIFSFPLESHTGMTTLGGWLIEKMGNIPKSGATYIDHGFLFKILSADPNRIRRVYIRRLPHPPQTPPTRGSL